MGKCTTHLPINQLGTEVVEAAIGEQGVCNERKRKYYRFRAARFYGGIATADCMGCNLHIRLSFKTGTPDNFEQITNRPKEWFELPLKAAVSLYAHQVSFHVAVVADYAHEYLLLRLRGIAPELVDGLEVEPLRINPHIERRLRARGLR